VQLALALDSPLLGKVKNDRNIMVYPFFALTKERVNELTPYDDGQVQIRILGTKLGVATIWDAEILIYLGSLMQDKINRGEHTSLEGRRFNFTAHDFFRVTGLPPNNRSYERLIESLKRLQSTSVHTTIETGGEGEDGAFSWISDFKAQYRRDATGNKILKAFTVELCPWLWRAILKDKRMLTYDPAYFSLPPIEKRLYEIARAHCGHQSGFKINIEKLRRKVGTQQELKHFKAELARIGRRRQPLPGYGLSLINPRITRSLDPKQPKICGRTPLKSYLVFFYSTERPARIPAASQVPTIDEEDFPASELPR
jgi:plasmid replication initiation protein